MGGLHDPRDQLTIADDDLIGAVQDRHLSALRVVDAEHHGPDVRGRPAGRLL